MGNIIDFLSKLFDTSSWPPRWRCGEWTDFHGWLYIISDIAIWAAYAAIPIGMLWFLYRKQSIPFKKLLILFVAFILACGATHLMDAIIFWWPAYRLSALLRFITAVISVITVIALVRTLPSLLAFRSPEELQKEIKQREKAEQSLRENETRFRGLFENAGLGVALVNPEGKPELTNRALQEMLGYTGEEMEEMTFAEFTHPDDVNADVKLYGELMEGKRQAYTLEKRYVRKDKKIVSANLTVSLIPESEGAPAYGIGMVQDITQLKEAQQEINFLLETSARLMLMSDVNDALELLVKDFCDNQGWHLGAVWKPSQIDGNGNPIYTGKLVYTKGNPNDYVELIDEFALESDTLIGRVAESGRAEWIEDIEKIDTSTYTRKQEALRLGIKSIFAIPLLADGELLMVLSFSDIKPRTDNKRAAQIAQSLSGHIAPIVQSKIANAEINALNESLEIKVANRTQQLEAANKELEAFSYSVSHDLRAPLRSIDGFSQILVEDHAPQLNNEARRVLDVVRSNTQRMGQLIDDLLAFSRLGRKAINPSTLNVEQMVSEIAEELKQANPSYQHKLIIQQLEPVEGDRSLLRQAFTNLISNAFKFSNERENPVIEINSTQENGRIIYRIKDNGVGFDMAYADKLFGVFQRLHRNDEFEGTGVGLALVQRIVNRHQGQIWADAEPNNGATFFVSLPQTIEKTNQKTNLIETYE